MQNVSIDSQRPTLLRIREPNRANLVLELIRYRAPRLAAVSGLQHLEALIRFEQVFNFLTRFLGPGFLVAVFDRFEAASAHSVQPAYILVDKVRGEKRVA